MKLTFKDLKQQKFVIEAEPSELISEVKEKISSEKGWAPATQKLIYSGKILQDDKSVESYKIEEKGFIVCMTSKPKATPAASASASASTPKAPSTPAPAGPVSLTPLVPAAPAQAATTHSSAPPATPSPAGATATAATTTSTPAPFGDSSSAMLGAQRAEAVANLESMGFERAQVEQAMRAAFYNPDRAVEYLVNGIPANLQQEQRAPANPAAAAAATPSAAPTSQEAPADPDNINLFDAAANAGSNSRGADRGGAAARNRLFGLEGAGGGGAGGGAGGGLGNLDFLRNNPQFQQLRQVVQQQPQMLEPILQQVGAGNPQLAELIGSHPQQFLQLLGEDGQDDEAALPPGAQAISVTDAERDAIERLCRLGFDRDQAIQAYFACDKNEELAANLLFEQPDFDTNDEAEGRGGGGGGGAGQ